MTSTLVLAITGASGAAYGVRLLEVLLTSGRDVHLVISPSGKAVIQQELGLTVDLNKFNLDSLLSMDAHNTTDSKLQMLRAASGVSTGKSSVLSFVGKDSGDAIYHHFQNFAAPIASGSFLTDAMIICPCSGSTMSAIAHGTSNNLIHRAADVHLKERRKLILVPRETPLSTIYLENMRRCLEAGAVILPAMPGFYLEPKSIQDLVDFIVARICDQVGISNALVSRWGEDKRPVF